jgi:hypothetical protein
MHTLARANCVCCSTSMAWWSVGMCAPANVPDNMLQWLIWTPGLWNGRLLYTDAILCYAP